MNTLRRVGLVAVSCIILLLSLLCPVSAVSFVEEDDFLINDDLMIMPNGTLSNSNVSTTDLASSPNYPQFNPNMIPWKDAPDYVKEVLISNLNDLNKPGNPLYFETPVKVPFVCVRVNGSNVMVYVGYNLCVLFITNNRPVLGRVVAPGFNPNDSTDVKMLSSTLYRASFNLSDMSVITPWYDASSSFTRLDSLPVQSVFSYTSALTTVTGKYDLYFFGANYIFADSSLNSSGRYDIPLDSSNDPIYNYVYLNYPLGFEAGSNFFPYEPVFTNTYCQYFVPKTMPDVNTGIVGEYGDAESNLVDRYNPDGLGKDLTIDFDSTTWVVVFNIFNLFITDNTFLYLLISTLLTFGIIALILGR